LTTETIVNFIQLTVTATCMVIALHRAVRRESREWVLLGLFYALFFMGDLYWSLMLAFYGKTPEYFYVSEIGWYSSYLFLDLLLRQLASDEEMEYHHKVLWIAPAFTVAMAVFYMQYGDFIVNAIVAVLMGFLLWRSIRGLVYSRAGSGNADNTGMRPLYWSMLAFCLIEYCEWTASCFMAREDVRMLYFAFDAAMTLVLILLIPALGKAVHE